MPASDETPPPSLPRWEPWQREYENGLFLLLPPTDVADSVNELRRRYDPRSAAICDAHITLSEPLADPLTDGQLGELRCVLEELQPIEFTYGPITDMGRPPGVVLAITPTDPFFELRRSIHGTSAFKGNPLPRADRAPHMTVAEFISLERTAELLDELADTPTGSFCCDAVTLAVPDPSFRFSPALTIAIGGQPTVAEVDPPS